MQLEYFQLVDRIDELDRQAGLIKSTAEVPTESTIFEGHFPDHPILPGVLLVETMAQTSGFMLLALEDFDRLPFLIQIVTAKLRTFVVPGELLKVTGELIHQGSGYAVTKGEIFREDKSIAGAELRFRIMPFPTEHLQSRVRERAQVVGLAAATI